MYMSIVLCRLALVAATAYSIIWYIFAPSVNQCQMTFMMEPPKFMPVPVDIDNNLEQDSRNHQYSLFMYSEMGFPLTSNIYMDLNDSMPVLFVPGNAGSYQQVRSIASTSIRRQMQSIEASKFIFYTVDFKNELSGISGELIEKQTRFVYKCLKRIQKLHPIETKGVIVIGHSVGGFVAKALFTMPGFEPSTVPLMISLGGPLVKPYLMFDDKMAQLYASTDLFWSKRGYELNQTISISLSGGKPDRLVPPHLSADSHYDISLTTSAVRDVWMPTDHVGITWCRELMHKLSSLLSALMDKRRTQLVDDKNLARQIAIQELLTRGASRETQQQSVITSKDWKRIRSHLILDFLYNMDLFRENLGQQTVLLNINSTEDDLLVWVEHIGKLKPKSIFGCKIALSSTGDELTCLGRIDLDYFSQTIPSRRFEPRKTAYLLTRERLKSGINYLVLDFALNGRTTSFSNDHKCPESITLIDVNIPDKRKLLYAPSLLTTIFHRILPFQKRQIKLSPPAGRQLKSLAFESFQVENLNYPGQILSLRYTSQKCLTNTQSRFTTVLFYHNTDLVNSFHTTQDSNESMSTNIRLRSIPAVRVNVADKDVSTSGYRLDFYYDASCDNRIEFESDLVEVVVLKAQLHLTTILIQAAYLSYISTVVCSKRLIGNKPTGVLGDILHLSIRLGGSIVIQLFATNQPTFPTSLISTNCLDAIIEMFFIYLISQGFEALIAFLIERLIDLASVVNKLLIFITNRLLSFKTKNSDTLIDKDDSEKDQPNSQSNQEGMSIFAITGLILAFAAILPVAFMNVMTIVILIIRGLSIAHIRQKQQKEMLEQTGCNNVNRHCCNRVDRLLIDKKSKDLLNHHVNFHNWVVNVSVMCSLTLITNIPPALVRLKSGTTIDNLIKIQLNSYYVASGIAMCLIVMLDKTISCSVPKTERKEVRDKPKHLVDTLITTVLSYAHLVALLPIAQIDLNIRIMNVAFLATIFWSGAYILWNKNFIS